MAGIRDLEKAITAIQKGNLEEGARLIRIALRDPNLTSKLRATAYIWQAETKDSRADKIQCYQDALNADPTNIHAEKRLSEMLEQGLPMPGDNSPTQPTATIDTQQLAQPVTTPLDPMPIVPPNMVQQPVQQQQPQQQSANPTITRLLRTVGIMDGPSGAGTGFFIRADGLIATTRLVTGGMESMTVELEHGNLMRGRVVRSFPEFDLSLIKIDAQVMNLLPSTLLTTVPENMELTAISHTGKVIGGRCRATKRSMKAHWFPTTFRQSPDVGGSPIFDERNYLIGMLTRNASRVSPDLFGLHISVIRSCADLYQQEIMTDPNRVYCPSCGYLSRAASQGAFYCETCGSILPHARAVQRFQVTQASALYNENLYRPCRHCSSRVGYYNGVCLRCGKAV